MKHHNMKLLSVILVLFCMFLLVGCPDNVYRGKTVYALLPLSGPVGEVGQVIRKTMEMYKKSHPNINFRLEFIDSESSPEKASKSLSQKLLISGIEKPVVITALSSIGNMAIPIVNSMDGFVIALCTSEVNLNGSEKNYLRFCVGPKDIIDPLAFYIKRFGSIAVFYSNDDYGNSYLARLKKDISEYSVEIKTAIPFSLTDQNARVNVQKALNMKPDAVVVLGMPTTAYISHVRELKTQGFKGTIIGDNSFVNPYVYQKLGNDAEGVISICTTSDFSNPTTSVAKNFRNDCEKEGIVVYNVSSTTYDVLTILDNVFETGEILSQNLFIEMKSFEGATGKVIFEDNGETSFKCTYAIIKGQKVEKLDEF